MTTDDYRYVDGLPSRVPIWGTELALSSPKGQRITITTARFDPSLEWSTGMLIGNRTVWIVNDDLMKAKIKKIQHWTAEVGKWFDQDRKVPARHRSVLADFLMARWNKGKLRGRINATL